MNIKSIYSLFLVICLGLLFAPTTTLAKRKSSKLAHQYTKDLSLPSKAQVKIIKLDPVAKMILLESVKFPGEEDSWVRAREFSKSIKVSPKKKARVDALIRNLSKYLLGQTFPLKQKITTYIRKN